MTPTCYTGCAPLAHVTTHAPVVPHAAHLAFTGFSIWPFVVFGAVCIVLGVVGILCMTMWTDPPRWRRRAWWRGQ